MLHIAIVSSCKMSDTEEDGSRNISFFEMEDNEKYRTQNRLRNNCSNASKIIFIIWSLVLVSIVIGVNVHQSAKIQDLKIESEKMRDKLSSNSEDLKLKYQDQIDFLMRAASAQDCQELRMHGYHQNGRYLIDPDGRYFGVQSFEVYCNFEKNLTQISPKKGEFIMNEGIEYEADISWIAKLIEGSGSCYQQFSIDCVHGQNEVFWEDRYGSKHQIEAFQCGEKIKISDDWYLPIQSLRSLDHIEEKIILEDLTCTEVLDIDIEGDLNGLEFNKSVNHWGDSYNFEFDIQVGQNFSKGLCKAILEPHDAFLGLHPGVYLCTSFTLAFEFRRKNGYSPLTGDHVIIKSYPLTNGTKHHIQFQQLPQDDFNAFRRVLKIDHVTVEDKEVPKESVSITDVNLMISDVKPYASISNLKVTK